MSTMTVVWPERIVVASRDGVVVAMPINVCRAVIIVSVAAVDWAAIRVTVAAVRTVSGVVATWYAWVVRSVRLAHLDTETS